MARNLTDFWPECRTFSAIFVILCFCFHSYSCEQNGIVCYEVKKQFEVKGYNIKDVPYWPIQGDHLRICPQGMTCCSKETEEQLSKQSQTDFDNALDDITDSVRHTFKSRTQKFDQFFTELLENAKRDLHNMFVRTYGLLYQRNSDVFSDLFADLNSYYKGKDLNLGDAFDKFFAVLMQKMFTLLNEQYRLDPSYLECVTEYLDDVKPFGDVPQTLSAQVKRAFIAARTFVQGLAVGRDVLNTVIKVDLSSSCRSAVMKMKYCPSCAGHSSVKPCQHYCMNVMKGCLAYHAELDKEWNGYIDAMMQLAERLEGPFNIEAVVDPMSLKISDAIMNFQENSAKVSSKVFSGCGRPRLPGRKRRDATNLDNSAAAQITPKGPDGDKNDDNESFDEFPYNDFKYRAGVRPTTAAGTSLDRLVRDIKNKVRQAYGLWGNLSSSICDKEASTAGADETCWNGNSIGSYVPEVMDDGFLNQVNNPEVVIDLNKPNSLINQQILQLRLIVSKLKNAFHGHDVEWIDSADVSDNTAGSSGSGDNEFDQSGSGSGEGSNADTTDPGFQFGFKPPDNGGSHFNTGNPGQSKKAYVDKSAGTSAVSAWSLLVILLITVVARVHS